MLFPKCVSVLHFPTYRSSFVIICILVDCHSDLGKIESNYSFILISQIAKKIEHFLKGFLAICITSLRTFCSAPQTILFFLMFNYFYFVCISILLGVSFAVIKYHRERQLRDKRTHFIIHFSSYFLLLREVSVGAQDRSLEAGTEVETIEK